METQECRRRGETIINRELNPAGEKVIRCMYTNLDGYNNKRIELQARIETIMPDIIGLTEINPKSASWNLTQQDLKINGYSMYANLEGRGTALARSMQVR